MDNRLIRINFARRMKGLIYCPRCAALGKKPKVLGKYEDVVGKGYVDLWCKSCRKEVRVRIEDISLDR